MFVKYCFHYRRQRADVHLKLKRPLPNKKNESSPKRLRLESCGDAFATSDEDLNQGQLGSQAKVINLSKEAPMSCNPNDISFDALTQSFGPNNMVFTCRGSPNKILENVFLNVSQDCLLSDSIYDEHDDRSGSKKLSEIAVQTCSRYVNKVLNKLIKICNSQTIRLLILKIIVIINSIDGERC